MARKKQIKYIQMDVDMREDSKIMKLCYYIDDDADIIFVEFVRAIFIEKSYYIPFNSDLFLLIARRRKKWTVEVIQAIFDRCIELNLFDKNLFEKYGILTSKSIQERFFQTAEASKWRNITIVKEYFLLANLEEFTNKNGNIYDVQTLNSNSTDIFNSELKSENIPKSDFNSELKSGNATKSGFNSELWALKEYNKKDLDKSKSNLNHPQPPKSELLDLVGAGWDFEKWFSHYPVDWAGINDRKAYKRSCQREWNALTSQECQACALYLQKQIAAILSVPSDAAGSLSVPGKALASLSLAEVRSFLSTGGLRSPLFHLRNKDFYAAQSPNHNRIASRKSNPERAQQAMQNAYTKNDLEKPFVLKNEVIEC